MFNEHVNLWKFCPLRAILANFKISRGRDNLEISVFFFIDIFQEWCYNHYIHHPFYVVDRGWVAAGDLVEGDEIYLLDGTVAYVTGSEIEKLDEAILVYNLEVADFNTYFVGDEAVLVHNYNADKKRVSLNDDGTFITPAIIYR